jgi:hypothetical protein
MGIRANITLTDATPVTPVNRVYSPTQSGDGLIRWQDRTQAVFVGQNRLTVSQRLADKQAKTNKFVFKLETPILEQTSPSTSTGIQPAPTVAYTPVVTAEFVLPDRMTLQERKDLLAQFRDLVAEAIVTNMVHDLDLIW